MLEGYLCENFFFIYFHVSFLAAVDDSNSEKMNTLTEERIIEEMESFYPNPISVEDLSR